MMFFKLSQIARKSTQNTLTMAHNAIAADDSPDDNNDASDDSLALRSKRTGKVIDYIYCILRAPQQQCPRLHHCELERRNPAGVFKC
jgi:hypothetical protein